MFHHASFCFHLRVWMASVHACSSVQRPCSRLRGLSIRVKARPFGEVFSFLSGLYFRGKLAYAEAFAHPPPKLKSGVFIITTNRGLLTPSTRVSLADLASLARTEIGHSSEQFRVPLQRDAEWVASSLGARGEPVLLGSIASAKYIDVLLSIFDEQLRFPGEFVGRGDMSRGGLLLRCVDANLELAYRPVRGAVRHGVRPAKLPPRSNGPAA
jgi:hypothetical protein